MAAKTREQQCIEEEIELRGVAMVRELQGSAGARDAVAADFWRARIAEAKFGKQTAAWALCSGRFFFAVKIGPGRSPLTVLAEPFVLETSFPAHDYGAEVSGRRRWAGRTGFRAAGPATPLAPPRAADDCVRVHALRYKRLAPDILQPRIGERGVKIFEQRVAGGLRGFVGFYKIDQLCEFIHLVPFRKTDGS